MDTVANADDCSGLCSTQPVRAECATYGWHWGWSLSRQSSEGPKSQPKQKFVLYSPHNGSEEFTSWCWRSLICRAFCVCGKLHICLLSQTRRLSHLSFSFLATERWSIFQHYKSGLSSTCFLSAKVNVCSTLHRLCWTNDRKCPTRFCVETNGIYSFLTLLAQVNNVRRGQHEFLSCLRNWKKIISLEQSRQFSVKCIWKAEMPTQVLRSVLEPCLWRRSLVHQFGSLPTFEHSQTVSFALPVTGANNWWSAKVLFTSTKEQSCSVMLFVWK